MKTKFLHLIEIAFSFIVALLLCMIGRTAIADVIWTFDSDIQGIIPYEDGFFVTEGDNVWYLDNTLSSSPKPIDQSCLRMDSILVLFTDEAGTIFALTQSAEASKGYLFSLCQLTLSSFTFEITRTIPLPQSEKPDIPQYKGFVSGNEVILFLGKAVHMYNQDQEQWHFSQLNTDRPYIPYRDGKVLISQTAQHAHGYQQGIVSLNLLTGTLETVAFIDRNPKAMTYDFTRDRIAFIIPPIVYTVSPLGEAVPSGYVPITTDLQYDSCCVTNNGLFILGDGNRLLMTTLDPTFKQEQADFLVIAHFAEEGEETRQFRKTNPEIPVLTMSMGYSLTPSKISEMIRGHDEQIDIFMVRTFEPGYQALLDKGFCDPLSQDDVLNQLASEMPPRIATALIREGNLLGLPVDIAYDSWLSLECSREALDEIGVSYDNIPTNVSDLLDWILLLYDQNKMSGLRLFNADDPIDALTQFVVWSYCEYMTIDAPYPDFDSSLFHDLMRKTEQIISDINAHPTAPYDAQWLFSYAYEDFIIPNGMNTSGNYHLAMTPDRNMEQYFPIIVTVAVVNPLSKHKQSAHTYLRTVSHLLDPYTSLVIWPTLAVPVEDPFYQTSRSSYLNAIEMYERLLSDNTVESEWQLIYKDELLKIQQSLDDLDENGRWLLSPERIKHYMPLANRICIPSGFAYQFWWENSMINLRHQFTNGLINSEQFVKTCHQKALMMQRE